MGPSTMVPLSPQRYAPPPLCLTGPKDDEERGSLANVGVSGTPGGDALGLFDVILDVNVNCKIVQNLCLLRLDIFLIFGGALAAQPFLSLPQNQQQSKPF